MPEPRFEIFIDGGCVMCNHEAKLMRRLDRGRGLLQITDVMDPGFEPPRAPSGEALTFERMMRSIHGRYPDGTVVDGVEVFRAAYSSVGWGWLWAPTGWPIVRPLLDRLYKVFAAWRFKRRVRQGCGLSQPA